ncbi:MAG TPA: hypothetical protein VIS05_09775 [Ilumatobacter sp.]
MNQDFAQRRRVAVALAITVIAVPAAFLLNRDNSADPASPTITLVGEVDLGSDPDADGVESPSATDAMGTAPVGFLDGTQPARADDPATIAIPRLPASIDGRASFRYSIVDVVGCLARGVPQGALVTVSNRDNSRSVTCINNVEIEGFDVSQMTDDVLLHPDAFLQIGDLTDAPIPVQIIW